MYNSRSSEPLQICTTSRKSDINAILTVLQHERSFGSERDANDGPSASFDVVDMREDVAGRREMQEMCKEMGWPS